MIGFSLHTYTFYFLCVAAFFLFAPLCMLILIKACYRVDLDEQREISDKEFMDYCKRTREALLVEEVSDHSNAVSIFNLVNKCGRLPFDLDNDAFLKNRKIFLDSISYAERRVFFLTKTYSTNLSEGKVRERSATSKVAYVSLKAYQRNIWQIVDFGIDPAISDARTPLEHRDFRPLRIIIDSLSSNNFPNCHIFMEVFKFDYERLAVLEFCGFEEMDAPPYELDSVDKAVYALKRDQKNAKKVT